MDEWVAKQIAEKDAEIAKLRAVADAAESLVRAPLGLTAEEIEERHERRMCLANALKAAKDGGAL